MVMEKRQILQSTYNFLKGGVDRFSKKVALLMMSPFEWHTSLVMTPLTLSNEPWKPVDSSSPVRTAFASKRDGLWSATTADAQGQMTSVERGRAVSCHVGVL